MSDSVTIGRGVLQLDVDATGVQAKLDTTTRSIDAYVKKIQDQAANIGKTTSELKLQELAQKGATQAQLDAYTAAQKTIEAYRQQQTEARKAAQEAIAAARAQAAANALASGSLNVIQVSELGHAIRATVEMIATGQNPLRALATEGFRFSSIMGGVREAFQAVSSIFTTVRVVAGGLLAVLGGIGYAFYEGARQSKEFNETIIKTGNYAGQTGDSFNAMARSVAESTHSSIGSVRELGLVLLQSGDIPQQAFAKAVEAAQSYARLTGKTAEEIAKDFEAMSEDPTKFAAKLVKAMNLANSAQYQSIKAFQEHQEKASAVDVIYGLLNERANKLRESQGYLGKTLEGVKNLWSAFWDAAYDVGRPDKDNISSRLSAINAQIKGPDISGHRADLIAERDKLLAQQQGDVANATKDAAVEKTNKDAIAGSLFIDDLAKRGKSIDLYKTKLAELNKAIADNRAAGTPIPQATIDAAKKGLFNEFGDKSAKSGVKDIRARAAEQAAAVKAEYETQIKDQQNALSILEAQRSAGLVDEQVYYDTKAAFIEKDKDLTVSSLEAQRQKFQDIAGKLKGADLSENTKKIIELGTQISDAQKKAATQETLLSIQRVQAIRAITAAYQAEFAAAQTVLDIQNRNQARTVQDVGLGDENRNRLAQRNALQDSYDAQRIQAEQAKAQLIALDKYTETQQRMYQDKLSVINEFEQKALESFDQYEEKLAEAQGSAINGASRAVQNYLSQAHNIADQTASLVSNAFNGLEDNLASALSTGKADWKGFLTSIQTDINKIAIKSAFSQLFDFAKGGGFGDTIAGLATKLTDVTGGKGNPAMLAQNVAIGANTLALDTSTLSLAGFDASILAATTSLALMAANSAGQAGGDALGTFITAMGWAGAGHAAGGPVSAGGLYPVNEKGPELLNVAGKQYLMMGANDGSITPNGGYSSAANSPTIIVNVAPPPGASRETAMQFGAVAAKQMQVALRRNG